jgi:hypothetical protein
LRISVVDSPSAMYHTFRREPLAAKIRYPSYPLRRNLP